MKIHPLTAKQRAAWWAVETHRLTVCEGAVRSGKSIAADHAFVDLAMHGPDGNLLLTGKTQDTVKHNVIDPLIELFGDEVCHFKQGTRELFIRGPERERRIYVVGANDERSEQKIRGVTLAGAYVDEASTVPESFFTMLLSRLSVEGARLIATTNPDSPMHWLKRRYLDRAQDLGMARFAFRLDDNPYLPASYIEALKREYTGLWYKRFIEGAWVAAEGAIYDMLDLDRHVVEQLPVIETWWLAVDYGTANPFHALLLGLGADERLYVAREWRWASQEKQRQLTDAEYSQRLRDWVRGGADGAYALGGRPAPVPVRALIHDPSAASFHAQLFRDGWARPKDAENDVLDGIRYTASLLSAGRLLIHRSCEHLLRELAGYVWDPKAQERGQDAPLKVDDHGPDALRYGCFTTRRHTRHWIASALKEAG